MHVHNMVHKTSRLHITLDIIITFFSLLHQSGKSSVLCSTPAYACLFVVRYIRFESTTSFFLAGCSHHITDLVKSRNMQQHATWCVSVHKTGHSLLRDSESKQEAFRVYLNRSISQQTKTKTLISSLLL